MKNQISQSFRNLFSRQRLLLPLFLVTLFTIFNGGVHVYIKCTFSIIAFFVLWPIIKRVKNVGLLIAFCVINAIMSYINHITGSYFELFSFLLTPIVFYLYGYYVVKNTDSDNDVSLFLLLVMIASCFMLWNAMISDAAVEGLINTSRHVYDEGVILHSATLLGLIASIGLGGVSYTIMYGFKNKLMSLMFLACTALSLFAVLHLVNRSGIAVVLGTIIITILYTIFKKRSSVIIVLVLLIILYYLYLQADVFTGDLYDAYDARSASMEGGSQRFERWSRSLKYLFLYPFGWRQLGVMGYSHNLWLDVAACTGIVPFFLLIVFSIKCYMNTISLFAIKGTPMNGFLIGLNVCFFLSAFVEPVIEALSTYFCLMCLIWGIQQAHLEVLIKRSTSGLL